MKKRPSAPSDGVNSPLSGLFSALPPELLGRLFSALTAPRSGQNAPGRSDGRQNFNSPSPQNAGWQNFNPPFPQDAGQQNFNPSFPQNAGWQNFNPPFPQNASAGNGQRAHPQPFNPSSPQNAGWQNFNSPFPQDAGQQNFNPSFPQGGSRQDFNSPVPQSDNFKSSCRRDERSHGQAALWAEGPPDPDFPNPGAHACRDLLLRHEALSRRIDREHGKDRP